MLSPHSDTASLMKITALTCSKHLGEAVWYVQGKSSWLLKGFSKSRDEREKKKKENLSSFEKHSLLHCSQLYSSVTDKYVLWYSLRSVWQDFEQRNPWTLGTLPNETRDETKWTSIVDWRLEEVLKTHLSTMTPRYVEMKYTDTTCMYSLY